MLKRSLSKFLKEKRAIAGLILIAILLVAALVGPFLVADPYDQGAKAFVAPGRTHIMGTDALGRDVLARTVYGARYSLGVGLLAVLLAFLMGMIAGSLAGYFGGITDTLIMRVADVFLAFPYVLGAIALMAVLGAGFYNVAVAIAIFSWAYFARLYRSSVLEIKEHDYITAAKVSGASDLRIMFRHILPNAVVPLCALATAEVAGAVLGESVLSFIGLGIPVPYPSWGRMLSDALNHVSSAPWLMIAPGLFILLTALSFILLGDGLRDALDPKEAGRAQS